MSAGIKLESLVKEFRSREGPVHAVRGVHLTVAAGETLALLGPSGAGKSTTAEHRSRKLSDGQRQRVRFASAMVSDPKLLVLDEPTVSMDAAARRDFWTVVRGFAGRGRTVIFATHLLEEAETYAERTVLMAHGRIVADAPTAELNAQVTTKTIRAILPDADIAALATLPGVATADREGEVVILACFDSNLALRALLERYPSARDFEVSGKGLEQALLDPADD